RRRFPTSSRGATLSRVIANAYALGFNSRPLRVDLEYLPRLQTPCILHWNLNHFVVLKRVTATRVEIHDPASGFRSLSVSDFGKHFTGIALELQPNSEFVREKEQQPISLRALAGDLRGLGSSILQVLMLAVGLDVLALTIPLYLQTVLDQVIVTNDSRLMTLLGIAFLVVVTLRAGTVAARGWAISWIGGRLNAQWVANLFAHMLRLPMSYFERRHTGDLT